MRTACAQDLRDRVLAAYDRGIKTRPIANLFLVSPAWGGGSSSVGATICHSMSATTLFHSQRDDDDADREHRKFHRAGRPTEQHHRVILPAHDRLVSNPLQVVRYPPSLALVRMHACFE